MTTIKVCHAESRRRIDRYRCGYIDRMQHTYKKKAQIRKKSNRKSGARLM